MQKCCVYKIKESSKDLFTESHISEYVYVYDFANNPLEEYCIHFVYRHIFIDNLEPTSLILGYHILPCKEFEKHFDLYMDINQVNEKLRELGIYD